MTARAFQDAGAFQRNAFQSSYPDLDARSMAASVRITDSLLGVARAGSGILESIIVQAHGSGGTLAIYDTDNAAGAVAANLIISVASTALTDGEVLDLDYAFGVGIWVNTMTTSGIFLLTTRRY